MSGTQNLAETAADVGNVKSLLAPEIQGVVFVTGARGVGKSLFAIQADMPKNIFFLDFESKGRAWDEQLHFGTYLDVPQAVQTALAKGKDAKGKDSWALIKSTVDGIKEGQYTTFIIDTVGDFEATLADEIRYQPQQYGVRENQQGGGWGGIYPAMSNQIGNFVAKLHSKGIQLVIAVAHTKPAWTNAGPVPNKLKPHGVNEWHDRSILELVLIPGSYPPVPAALVQKEQLAKVEVTPEGLFTIQRRMPLRLPEATWFAINGYLANPADLKDPKDGEVPTDEEQSPYAEAFSKEQLSYLVQAVQAKPVEEA